MTAPVFTESQLYQKQRRWANEDIKLLRLELCSSAPSPFDLLGADWSTAQPTESLSPQAAAQALRVSPWASAGSVLDRYAQLQKRFPPELFFQKHVVWRPSAELLGEPVRRLNWHWQSGLVPFADDHGDEGAWALLRERYFHYLDHIP